MKHYHKPVYGVWNQMLQRCNNPNNPAYDRYGGRGIAVCERWEDFHLFYEDMGDPPEGLTLDRIDNEKGYSPDNCRWASSIEQANNRRNVRLIEFNGKKQSIRRWAAETKIPYLTLYTRLNRDQWPVNQALTAPVNTSKRNRKANASLVTN